MKKPLFLAALAVLITGCAFPSEPSKEPKQNTDSSTDPNVESCAEVSTDPSAGAKPAGPLRSVYGDLTGFSAESGSVKGIYEGERLLALTVMLYGETGRVRKDYSFFDSAVRISVFTETYDAPINADPVPSGSAERQDYLLAGGTLYDCDVTAGGMTPVALYKSVKSEMDLFIEAVRSLR